MIRNMVERDYLDWMINLVCPDDSTEYGSFRKLLSHLHDIRFTWCIKGDADRAYDGVNLRHRFALRQKEYDYQTVDDILTGFPCTVLEMIIALAIRCEETIMDDTRYGNRTAQWFWKMIVNLGLGHMTDALYDPSEVKIVIYRFLDREYKRDGRGGLFVIKNCEDDLRDVSIWTQMMWYLDTLI